MKKLIGIVTFILFVFSSKGLLSANSDRVAFNSIAVALEQVYPDEAGDISPMMFALMAVGLALVFAAAVLALLMTAILLLLVFGLIMSGIVSASLMVAIKQRSLAKGFKVLFLFVSAFAGTFAGMLIFWILYRLFHWWPLETALVCGSVCGLVAGVTVGSLAFYLVRKLSVFFTAKISEIGLNH